MMYIASICSTCVCAATRGVVVCRCGGRFVGESRIRTGVRSDVSNTDRVQILPGRDVRFKVCSAVPEGAPEPKGPASQGSTVPGAGACGAASSERGKAVCGSSEGAALSVV